MIYEQEVDEEFNYDVANSYFLTFSGDVSFNGYIILISFNITLEGTPTIMGKLGLDKIILATRAPNSYSWRLNLVASYA